MTEFERDVIDRLARIETNAANAATLAETVTLQGARLDSLDRRFEAVKNRMWGVIVLGPLLIPLAVDYVRIHLLGINFKP